jgi:uncharacterized membrane protein YqjE
MKKNEREEIKKIESELKKEKRNKIQVGIMAMLVVVVVALNST